MKDTFKKIYIKLKKSKSEIRTCFYNHISKVEPNPILILGNQKSGTTVIAALLSEATMLSSALDIFYRKPGSLREILDGDLSLKSFIKKNKSYFSKRIIKDPDFTFITEELLKIYKDSPVIFILRDPVENVRSILNRLKIPGDTEFLSRLEIENLENNSPEWSDIINGRRYGTHNINPVICLLRRAVNAHRICIEFNKLWKNQLVVIRYEDFLEDKNLCIEELCGRLGIRKSKDISSKLDIQFQPKGQTHINKISFFGERNWCRIVEELASHDTNQVLRINGYDKIT